MTDPLAQVVTLLQPQAVLMTEIRGRGQWGIRFSSFRVTNFAIVAEGECWLKLADGEPMPFRTGDFLLQPEAGEFAFLSAPDAPAVFGDAAYKAAAGPIIRLGNGEGESTRIIGGYCKVDRVNTDLFAALLPRAVHVRSNDVGAGRIAARLADIVEEARDDRPGRTLILQRLVEILVLEALRRPVLAGGLPSSGLLAGLHDRGLAGALRAMHEDVRRDWTVSSLASAAGMSRSAFSQRFREVIGIPPMTYLLRWRMALAKAALIHEKLTLEEIAARTGYSSAGALSHAFLREVGSTPSSFRRSGVERSQY